MRGVYGLTMDEQKYLDSRSDCVLGIDPGLTGAIAVFTTSGVFMDVMDLPVIRKGGNSIVKNEIDATKIYHLLRPFRGSICLIERVTARPGQGVASMFSLGDSFGVVRGACAALEMTSFYMPPNIWKSVCNVSSDKEATRIQAIKLFPDAPLNRKKDHNRAEACLLAYYYFQQHRSN